MKREGGGSESLSLRRVDWQISKAGMHSLGFHETLHQIGQDGDTTTGPARVQASSTWEENDPQESETSGPEEFPSAFLSSHK